MTDSQSKPAWKERLKALASKCNRRTAVILASVALIGGAIYLNWLFFADDSTVAVSGGSKLIDYSGVSETGAASSGIPVAVSAETSESDGYFASVQINRRQARDEAIEVLKLVSDSEEALVDLREDASASIERIAANIEMEANIEALIVGKGFERCVAVINENSASIVVKTAGLMPNEVIQIKEIVCKQSGLSPSAVNIIEMN